MDLGKLAAMRFAATVGSNGLRSWTNSPPFRVMRLARKSFARGSQVENGSIAHADPDAGWIAAIKFLQASTQREGEIARLGSRNRLMGHGNHDRIGEAIGYLVKGHPLRIAIKHRPGFLKHSEPRLTLRGRGNPVFQRQRASFRAGRPALARRRAGPSVRAASRAPRTLPRRVARRIHRATPGPQPESPSARRSAPGPGQVADRAPISSPIPLLDEPPEILPLRSVPGPWPPEIPSYPVRVDPCPNFSPGAGRCRARSGSRGRERWSR